MKQDINKYLIKLYKKPMTVKILCKKMGIYEKTEGDIAVNYRKINQKFDGYITFEEMNNIGSDEDICILTEEGKNHVERIFKQKSEFNRWIIGIVIAILAIIVGIVLQT